jgi:hypothetical protein
MVYIRVPVGEIFCDATVKDDVPRASTYYEHVRTSRFGTIALRDCSKPCQPAVGTVQQCVYPIRLSPLYRRNRTAQFQ